MYTFIMGGDLVEKLPTWAHIDDLVQLVQLAAGKTTQQAGQSDYPIIWCDVPKIQISASDIRTKLRLKYWMPNAQPVDGRHASAIAPADRVQMVRQAIMGNPFFDLELIEIYHGGPSLTYQTMLALTQAHPENAALAKI
ncbi:hypothetical protein GQS40_02775|uniref:Uncharacterized protein n=1 Tax=Leuconostoc lactis TaxID=1246 RepID=A0A6L7A9I1_LEULA|nr:hypothetical protein [Leuconostoc lactis]